MITKNIYFKTDRLLFANGYERIVHGGRGDYMELKKEQICIPLRSKFNAILPSRITNNESFYYYYLVPFGRDEKIYWQCMTVNYADYKIGYYYISPKLLMNFSSNELF